MNSTKLRGYLTGLILGDGTIGKGVTRRSFEIKSINEDFIRKIESDLKSSTNFQIRVNKKDAFELNGVNRKDTYILTVSANPYFNKRYNFFYDDSRKRRITTESLEWLNEEGLANWYMSDGYICHVGKQSGVIKDRRVDICTDRYHLSDVIKIQNYFEKKWGWKTSIIRRKQNGKVVHRIRISLTSAQDFFLKINEHVTPSFKYKLNMKYDHKPNWMCDEYYNLMLQIEKCDCPNE